LRQVTHRRLLQQAHQKSGSFPPPALPSFIGTTTLSDSRSSRCPTAPLRPLPSLSTGLPRLRDPLSRRAVPITPVDRSRCVCRLLPQIVLPSPNSGRVGVHNFPFEACSGFIRITARRVARPPEADPGLRRGRLLSQGFDPADCSTEPPASYRANRPLPGWDLHPQGDRPLRGAPESRGDCQNVRGFFSADRLGSSAGLRAKSIQARCKNRPCVSSPGMIRRLCDCRSDALGPARP